MGLYAGKRTPGVCDRCSRRVPHASLLEEVVRGKPVGNLVCEDCYDEDHPQLWVGSIPIADRQSIKDAQPEPDIVESRSLHGFNPLFGQSMMLRTGILSVTTS